MASLNQLFNISGWNPDVLAPSGTATVEGLAEWMKALSLRLSIKANTGTTMTVLNNIERSIREFDIERATIGWGGEDELELQAQATAYYMDESTITETTETISAEDKQ